METLERTHVVTDPAILYFGTPVVLLSTVNPDGSPNLAPISSVFWLGHQAMRSADPRCMVPSIAVPGSTAAKATRSARPE